MHDPEAMVYLIDDDLRIHQAMSALFSSAGRKLKAFLDPDEFFAYGRPDVAACVVLDLQLPGTTGLEVQARLSGDRMSPTIFLTGKGDISSKVKAMKAGAVEFLEKPIDSDDLFAPVDAAILKDIASARNGSRQPTSQRATGGSRSKSAKFFPTWCPAC